MWLILAGCEYSGTTTLACAIKEWMEGALGAGDLLIHDHWKIPHTSGHLLVDETHLLTEEEQAQVLALSPKLKEMTQRHSLVYHTAGGGGDRLMVGYVFDEAVYGPLYWGYGGADEVVSRSTYGRYLEHRLLQSAPDVVLVHVTARAEVIADRMGRQPHPHGLLREQDIDHVLARFAGEVKKSLITNKIRLDTSDVSVEKTLVQFVEKMDPYLTSEDRIRILMHKERVRSDIHSEQQE